MFFFLFTLPFPIASSEPFLIESESPCGPLPGSLDFFALTSVESGAIPTSLIKPHIGYSPFKSLYLYAAPIFAYYYDTSDFLFTSWEAAVKCRLPFSGTDTLALFPYAKIRHAFADPYIVRYQGNLPGVQMVISQYSDRGLDLMGGITAVAPFTVNSRKAALLFSFEYARTILRDYTASFDGEGYKNRMYANITPALTFAPAKKIPAAISLYAQNRITYWFDRGFMYDLLPQATFSFNDNFSIIAGGSIPVIGGEVFKLYLGPRLEVDARNSLKFVTSDLYFPPDKAVLFGPENEKSKENERIIDDLYKKLKNYPDYIIVVEGHTSFVNWSDPVKGPIEQRDVLLPLSRDRAQAVMNALIQRGISASRISAVGKGGSQPVVPFFMTERQWKNRRVEITASKPKK